MEVLKYRSKGESVKKLQRMLNLDGHGLVVDGDFGNGTRYAVRSFQKKHKLIVDGIVGGYTWKVLEEVEKRPYRITKHDRQTVYVSFKKSDVNKIDVLNSQGAFETVQSMFRRSSPKPTLIVNGDLYDTKTGASLSKFIDEGKKITNGYYSQFGLIVEKDGTIRMGYENALTKDMIGASPTLVINGQIHIDSKGLDKGFLNNRHPRTLFVESKGEFHIVIIHGRRSLLGHRGMTINEAASFCHITLKAINAINFDGGGSCMLVDEFGQPINLPLEYRAIDNAVCVYL
jgi:peptidoglycan hydrolase-like protein with peptidoglycan-binding domain